VAAGTATAGEAALTAAVARSTACCASARPAWASAPGSTGTPSARARGGMAISATAIRSAIANQRAPPTCRPRLAIVYEGPRGMLSFTQIPTPLRSPAGAGLIHAGAQTTLGTIALIPPRGERAEVEG